MTQRMILIQSPLFLTEPQLRQQSWAELFGRRAPLALEIGCGVGDFIVQQAQLRPEWNFLAIDIYNKGCLKTVRRLEQEGVDNVRVLRMEARYLLHHFVDREALTAVYINCPDPWPKKRHRKRRLVSNELLEVLRWHLVPDGEVNFATDFTDYGEDVAALLAAHPGFVNQLPQPVNRERAGYPHSHYMQKFHRQGLPLYFVFFRKRPESLPADAAPPSFQDGFRLRWTTPESLPNS